MKTKKTKIHVKPVNLSNLITFESPAQKGVFTRINKALSLTPTQSQEIEELYVRADKRGLDEAQAELFLENFGKELKKVRKHLPPSVKKKLSSLKSLQKDMPLVGRFKTSLPWVSYVLLLATEGLKKKGFEDLWVNLQTGVVFVKGGTRGFGDTSANRTFVRRVLEASIYKTAEGYVQFTSGAAICIDGAPTAYGPDNKGQDLTSSAGHDNDWWAVETNDDGTPYIKPDGYYLSMSSYNYSGFAPGVRAQARYVNADIVSYAVLYAASIKEFGLTIGDLVYVKNKYKGKNLGKWCAFLETRREPDRIGEISVAAANAIGVPSNPRNGGQDADVEFTFYPNTAPNYHFKNDQEAAYYIHYNGKRIEAGEKVDRDLRKPA
jgi:hypothetical protein